MRQLAYAKVRALLDELIHELAPDGRCQNPICRRKPRKYPLEIHHLDGRAWEPRDLDSLARVKRYGDEHAAGVRLAAWCRPCNAADNSQVRSRMSYEQAARIMNKRRRSRP